MGIVGSISVVKKSKLKEFISKPDGNMKYGNNELYLDKAFRHINYVLTEYFDEEMQNQNLIYGSQKITDIYNGDEVHYAYSEINETKKLSETINQYAIEEFEEYLDKALNDRESMINYHNGDENFKKGTLMLFEELKSLYKKAANEGMSMIYVYG